jgi:hypothetical protein
MPDSIWMRFFQELSVSSDENPDHTDIELIQVSLSQLIAVEPTYLQGPML